MWSFDLKVKNKIVGADSISARGVAQSRTGAYGIAPMVVEKF